MADSTTSNIDEFLKQIQSAIYGEEVRSAIHDSIKQCYTDGKSFKKVEILDADDPTTGYLRGHLILTRIDDVQIDCGMALGEKGDTGEKGDPGEMPSITFHVQTGEPNTEVKMTTAGTAAAPDITFTIPRGSNGADGDGAVSYVDSIASIDKDVPLKAVRYAEQSLTAYQKQTARDNIGIARHETCSITLSASGWTGTAAPYTLDIPLFAAPDGDAFVGVSSSVTAEQYKAYCNAQIIATKYSGNGKSGTLTLKAFGTKPSIDLDARLLVMPINMMVDENGDEVPYGGMEQITIG